MRARMHACGFLEFLVFLCNGLGLGYDFIKNIVESLLSRNTKLL